MEYNNLIGKKIQINLHDRSFISKDITNKYFDSQITDYQNSLIEIYAPIVKRNYLPLKIGQTIDILYLNDENSKDSYEQFQASVEEQIKKDNFLIYAVKYLKQNTKSQKRDFFRLTFERDPDEIIIEGNNLDSSKLVDLSATGLKLKTKSNISIGDIVNINLRREKSKVFLSAKVLRVDNTDENKYNLAGLSFISISPYEEDIMIKYILNEQRKRIFLRNYK